MIVGGGVAGGTAAVALRKANYIVTIISLDPYVYSKMTLSYALKNNITSIDPYVILSPEDLKDLGVKFINDEVVYVDLHNRIIETKNSGKFEYDILVLATGSRVSAPKIEGLKLRNVFTFLSFNDMIMLNSAISPGKKAVVIGAGMIGLLVADSLHTRGVSVVLVDIMPYPLMTVVEEPISKIMLSRITAKGVRFIGNTSVERIEGEGKVERIVLASGERIPADIAVVCTGVTSNVPKGVEHLLKGPGGSILTDTYLRTDVRDVYAIGDCASSIDYVTGKPVYRPLGILASYEARLLPSALKNVGYKGFIAYQVEEAFGYYFMRLGLNGFEAKRLGLNYSVALIEYKVPGLRFLRSLVLFEKSTGRIIGWQSIGPAMISYKSKLFRDVIEQGGTLGDLQEKNIKILSEDPQS
ncbi:MAG: FAD-dependent oxidoreductase [Desulfurococcaceae archaeon]